MAEVPRFVYVQPSLREFIVNEFPEIEKYLSNKYSTTETVVIVGDSNTSLVDENGVLYLHPSIFDQFKTSLFEFFEDFDKGKTIKEAAQILMDKLQGENYEIKN